jgi:hypothetical protein
MWLLITLVSTSVSIYFIIETCSKYFEYNVSTEVRLVDAKELDFPVVTLCNKNKFSTEQSLYHINEYLIENLNISYYDFVNNMKGNRIIFDSVRAYLKYYDAKYIFSQFEMNIRSNFSKSISEMIIGCMFDLNRCDFNDFEWIFNSKYGKVSTPNANKF